MIDVKETFSKKLGIDFRNCCILGACNPTIARETLEAEDKVGTMLPRNVIVRGLGEGDVEVEVEVEVAAIDRLPLWRQLKTKPCAARHKRFAAC